MFPYGERWPDREGSAREATLLMATVQWRLACCLLVAVNKLLGDEPRGLMETKLRECSGAHLVPAFFASCAFSPPYHRLT